MIRKTCLAVVTVLAVATSSQAAIMITQSLSAVQPTLPSGGGPLVAYDVHAVSDDGTVLNGVNNPSTVTNLGMGLHQVWTALLNSPTPTRAEQLAGAPLTWDDSWRPYDSYWFFESANSLGVGGAFTETNDHAMGAVLPQGGAFGPPNTGFGQFGFTTISASKGYTIASGQQGTSINLGQFVMKAQDSVLLSLGILDNTGGNTPFNEVCVGLCQVPFEVGDLFLGGKLPGQIVTGGPLPTNDSDDPDDVAWSLVSLIGPDGPEVGATVDPLTGVFTWDSAPTDSRGAYTATIGGVNATGEPLGSDTGLLTFNLVPEPGTIALLGLGMLSLLGMGRRRD